MDPSDYYNLYKIEYLSLSGSAKCQEGLLCGQPAPSPHYAPIGQVGLPSNIALGFYNVAVINLQAVTNTTNLNSDFISW